MRSSVLSTPEAPHRDVTRAGDGEKISDPQVRRQVDDGYGRPFVIESDHHGCVVYGRDPPDEPELADDDRYRTEPPVHLDHDRARRVTAHRSDADHDRGRVIRLGHASTRARDQGRARVDTRGLTDAGKADERNATDDDVINRGVGPLRP
jgi:hypothetical protein